MSAGGGSRARAYWCQNSVPTTRPVVEYLAQTLLDHLDKEAKDGNYYTKLHIGTAKITIGGDSYLVPETVAKIHECLEKIRTLSGENEFEQGGNLVEILKELEEENSKLGKAKRSSSSFFTHSADYKALNEKVAKFFKDIKEAPVADSSFSMGR